MNIFNGFDLDEVNTTIKRWKTMKRTAEESIDAAYRIMLDDESRQCNMDRAQKVIDAARAFVNAVKEMDDSVRKYN